MAPSEPGYAERMLALSSEAVKAIQRLLGAPGVPSGAGIRVLAVAAGDGEVTSELEVELADQPGDRDEVIEEAGARVFVEDSLCYYLSDKLLDAEVREERIRFSLAGQAG